MRKTRIKTNFSNDGRKNFILRRALQNDRNWYEYSFHNGKWFFGSGYCKVLEKEFIRNDIPYQREVKLDLYFNGEKLDKKYKADFVCFDNMILEVKSVSFLHENFTKQTLNDLKATNKKLGLLINFGEKSLKYKRIIN